LSSANKAFSSCAYLQVAECLHSNTNAATCVDIDQILLARLPMSNSTLSCLSEGPPADGASDCVAPSVFLPASSSTAGPTLQVDRQVATQAVGTALMRMVLPALLKMSRAAVSKALQDKQVCSSFIVCSIALPFAQQCSTRHGRTCIELPLLGAHMTICKLVCRSE